ncbi:MAG: ribonuclease P protein component [candidate division WOR-3 bacterium]|nr:ribonuclease P protein component [candidate division WOR-3 bacterium]
MEDSLLVCKEFEIFKIEYRMENRYSFGKNRRITEKEEIRRVLLTGFFYPGNYLQIHYLPEAEKRFSIRLLQGIKGGYKRNKLRRLLREITRIAAPLLKDGLYIVEGKKMALNISYNKLKEDFNKVCLEGNLWQNS